MKWIFFYFLKNGTDKMNFFFHITVYIEKKNEMRWIKIRINHIIEIVFLYIIFMEFSIGSNLDILKIKKKEEEKNLKEYFVRAINSSHRISRILN